MQAPAAVATVAAPAEAPAVVAAPAPTAELELGNPDENGAGAERPRAVAKSLVAAPEAKPQGVLPGAPKAEPAPEPAKAPEATAKEQAEQKEAAKMKPAAQPTDIPQQPSNGAAQAAVAQVIGSARACVAGHEAPSRATLVFGSDGRVQSVAVSGPAAGTPAEACIRAALSRARVEPFAKPTFSVGTTIRP
jgi:hypothetical protein